MNLEELIKKNVAKPNFDELAAVMALDSEPFKLAELTKVCTKIKNAKARYDIVENATGVPWDFVGTFHFMEASLRFEACLHNGEPWNKKTTLVPKGRGPWTSFEEAAIDALKYDKLANKPKGYWTLARMLEFAESYNGTGYRKKGILSPYVFSYTNLSNEMGKYVADHVYDATKPHNRPSVGAILLMLKQMEKPMNNESNFGAPWVFANIDLLGRDETDPELNARYVPEWALEGLPSYKTLAGNRHAWCSLKVNADLRKVGIKGTNSAAASSWSKWGRKSPFWFGSILDISHQSGGRHVCFFLYWIDEAKGICATMDGNKGNMFCIAKTTLSAKADKLVAGPRWPDDAIDGQLVSMNDVLKAHPILKVGSNSNGSTR